ncbi:TetR/AcrR family transcriptional regulator [Marinactinospora rubrisoli]|uniref:TetR/AcrR family transcriptional regulator n=1 Tax=Marinactinospora rubrisoli TaxID=2715399 RepID=A0ABW2K9T1_9ACTN
MARPHGRAAATRAAIENAALDLALARGYEHVTVDLICEAAGVSQRTFFNHFPTKDDALLGRDMPRIDERAARRFVLSEGPLLLDAIALVDHPERKAVSPRLADRLKVISMSPPLLARQMERISAIDAELREIVALRLERRHPGADEAERADEAAMVAYLLAGFMRFIASMDMRGEFDVDDLEARARAALTRVLDDSAMCDAPAPPAAGREPADPPSRDVR